MRIAYHAARAGVACAREAEIFTSRLSGYGAAGFKNSGHHGCIEFWNITFEQGRTVHHRNAGDAYVVLDRDLLAGQQPFRVSTNVRFPVPSAVRIFGRVGPISWRSWCNRPKIGRDQFVEPAV